MFPLPKKPYPETVPDKHILPFAKKNVSNIIIFAKVNCPKMFLDICALSCTKILYFNDIMTTGFPGKAISQRKMR